MAVACSSWQQADESSDDQASRRAQGHVTQLLNVCCEPTVDANLTSLSVSDVGFASYFISLDIRLDVMTQEDDI